MSFPPEEPGPNPEERSLFSRRLSRRLALGALAVLVGASGAAFTVRLVSTQGNPNRRLSGVPGSLKAAPTAWARLGANATAAPVETPNTLRTSGRGEPVALWHPFSAADGDEPAAHAAVWQTYTRATGIPVEATSVPTTPSSNLTIALRAASAAGRPPDVVCVPRLDLPALFTGRTILPLTARAAPDGIGPADYYAAAWSDVQLAGQLLAVPFGADARGLWWRKRFFATNDVDAQRGPSTLTQLTALAGPPRTDASGTRQWGFSPYVGETHPYTWGVPFAARWYDGATQRFLATAAANVAALTWYAGRSTDGRPPSVAGGPHPLLSGAVQVLVDGQWVVAQLPAAQLGDFGAGPLPPAGSAPVRTWSSGYGIAVPAGTRNADRSWNLAVFYGGTAAALAYIQAKGRRVMPALPVLATHPDVVAPGPLWQGFLQMLPTAWARPAIADAAFAWGALAEAASQARSGTATPAQALQAVETAVNAARTAP